MFVTVSSLVLYECISLGKLSYLYLVFDVRVLGFGSFRLEVWSTSGRQVSPEEALVLQTCTKSLGILSVRLVYGAELILEISVRSLQAVVFSILEEVDPRCNVPEQILGGSLIGRTG